MMTLGSVLKKYRVMSEKNLRDMANEIGVSYPTLMRIEHGRSIDAKTLVTVMTWLIGEKNSLPKQGITNAKNV